MNTEIMNCLNLFDPISLKEMDSVKLLDRIDTKFVFHAELLPKILEEASVYYRMLEVKGTRMSQYETLYFDTDSLLLYQKHHNKHTNRFKIRFRKYVESNLSFFEIKFKNNKGRTIKERIKQRDITSAIENDAAEFLINKTQMEASDFLPQLWVNYHRITLVNRDSFERLTIDLGLTFICDGKSTCYNNLVIAEVKQEKANDSPFLGIMKEHKIRQGSISKYCFGVISMRDNVKSNNFKKNILTIKKVCHE